jgi:amidase
VAVPLLDAYSTATEMLAALRGGAITASELLELHLERIARLNPALNAIVTPDYERARARARENPVGALGGLPLTIKDSIDVRGLPTTSGDPARADALPERDSTLAARVLGAGGVLLGKTNVPLRTGDWQTYNALFGRTVNPWDASRTPGGSTGGGAAALAAGLTPLEFGSDIGGSIRVPAGFCGVFGHRPTEGAVPADGHFPEAQVMAVLGPLARSAGDLRTAMDVIAGPLPPARAEALADLRVAVLPWLDWLPVDAEVAGALEDLAARLPNARVAAPEGFDGWAHEELYAALLAYVTFDPDPALRRQVADAISRAPEPLAPAMLRGVRAGEAEYAGMLAERERWRESWARFFADHDVLLTPTAIVPAFAHDEGPFLRRRLEVNGEEVPYKRLEVYPGLAALSGLPATAIPAARTRSGLPIGVQAISGRFEDATCLHFAWLLEQEHGCRFAPPPDYALVPPRP